MICRWGWLKFLSGSGGRRLGDAGVRSFGAGGLAAYVLCSRGDAGGRSAMPQAKSASGWANRYNLRAAAVAALVLFAITYATDALLYYLRIAAAETILD